MGDSTPVINARSPLRADPSRTSPLARRFASGIVGRFNRVKREVRDLVATEDAFGLKDVARNESVTNRKYGCVLLNVTKENVIHKLRNLQFFIDVEDVIELEEEFHVTILYGLHTETASDVRPILEKKRVPSVITDKSLSLFENPEFDVLKLGVKGVGGELEALHKLLLTLPNTQTHTDYRPHLTIAYLKPGTGEKYVDLLTGVEGVRIDFEAFTFSSPERIHVPVLGNTLENTRFEFLSDDRKRQEFENWIASVLGSNVTPDDPRDAYWEEYIREAYYKGQGRAFDDTMKGRAAADDNLDFYNGKKSQFLESAFRHPPSIEKVKLLAGRTYTDIVGITETTAKELSKILVDGLIQGQNPLDMARSMVKTIEGISRSSANRIARTEIMRAHSEGQLDAFETLGVTELGVMSEWSTAGDDRVCPLCSPLEGIVVTVKEARGMLPRHPNCRCVWLPAQVGEQGKGQKKSVRKVNKAIDKSLKAEGRKKSLKDTTESSKWLGSDKKISGERPKPVVTEGAYYKAKRYAKTAGILGNLFPSLAKEVAIEAGVSEKVAKALLIAATIGDFSVPGVPVGSLLVILGGSAKDPKALIRAVKTIVKQLKGG